MLKIMDLNSCPAEPMERDRGEMVQLVHAGLGTDNLNLHLNRLKPGGARGKLHRHSQSDNIYIVRRGEGQLTADGRTYTIRQDQVVFIPAGTPHALSNVSGEPLELFEIYTPAGPRYDFELLD